MNRSELISLVVRLTKKLKRIPKRYEVLEFTSRHEIENRFNNYSSLIEAAKGRKEVKKLFEDIRKKESKDKVDAQLNKLCKVIEKIGRLPTYSEFVKHGLVESTLSRLIGGREELIKALKKFKPDIFDKLPDIEFVSKKQESRLKKISQTKNNFVITTAVLGAPVDRSFLASLETYCKANDAELVILTCVNAIGQKRNWTSFDKALIDHSIVTGELKLGKHIHISGIKLTAKQKLPSSGLKYMTHKKSNFIIASPKQIVEFVPTRHESLPNAFITTGAVTVPEYRSKTYRQERSGAIAEYDHTMGAIVVQNDGDYFHFRNLTANDDGSFFDLGMLYSGDSVEKENPKLLVPGDVHIGHHSEEALKQFFKLTKKFKPEGVVLHDVWDGLNFCWHDRNKIITKTLKAEKEMSTDEEFKAVAKFLAQCAKLSDNVYVPAANHLDRFLRYLESGEWANPRVADPTRTRLMYKAFGVALEEENPLEHVIKSFMKLSESDKDRIKFLGRNDDLIIEGNQFAAHGDKRENGKKGGSLKQMAESYGPGIYNHSHSPGIYLDAMNTGTMTGKLQYAEGLSTWMQSIGCVYRGGAKQMINLINGKYQP